MHLAAKRLLDIVGSLMALIVLGPLMVLVALAIKCTDGGAAVFTQEREGLGGVRFEVYKFRSMRVDGAGDARVTWIGRLIRRTSVDELPQLINVLRGEMSLVGPRPHIGDMRAGGAAYRELVPYYGRRLEMLPGITGWAQANGLRGSADDPDKARARIDHDIAYIQNFSIWLDIAILLKTLRHEFLSGSGE